MCWGLPGEWGGDGSEGVLKNQSTRQEGDRVYLMDSRKGILWFHSPGTSPNPSKSNGANHCLARLQLLVAKKRTQKKREIKNSQVHIYDYTTIISYSWLQQVTPESDLNKVWAVWLTGLGTKHWQASHTKPEKSLKFFFCLHRGKLSLLTLKS